MVVEAPPIRSNRFGSAELESVVNRLVFVFAVRSVDPVAKKNKASKISRTAPSNKLKITIVSLTKNLQRRGVDQKLV